MKIFREATTTRRRRRERSSSRRSIVTWLGPHPNHEHAMMLPTYVQSLRMFLNRQKNIGRTFYIYVLMYCPVLGTYLAKPPK